MTAVWALTAGAAAAGTWLLLVPARPTARAGSQELAARLAEAGWGGIEPGRFRACVLVAAACAAVATLAATAAPALAAAAAAAAAAAPYRWLRGRRLKRRAQLRAAWPEAVDILVAAVRSGDSLPQALLQVSERGPEPLREACAAADAEYRASGDFAAGISRMTTRLADPSADRVGAALVLAKDLGGAQVTSVLTRFGDALRAELTLRREIEARRSWVVTSARAAAVAPWLVLTLFASRSDTLDAYRRPAGALVVLIGAVMTLSGYRLMLRVGRLPEEERFE